jgi:hypothetical protein
MINITIQLQQNDLDGDEFVLLSSDLGTRTGSRSSRS